MRTATNLPKQMKTLSLIDIFKYDDVESLKFYMRSNPELTNSTFINFTGEKLPVGAVSAAIHYKALNCLKILPINFDSYGEKMGGPSASHIACQNQWEPGLLYLMKHKVPFNTFDGHRKSPLAYVIDHENLKFFRYLLQFFEENGQIETALKNVSIEREGSLNFLSYCIDNKKIDMIESCGYALKKGFISKSEIKEAIQRWHSKSYDIEMPLFLSTFERSLKSQNDYKIENFFSPLVPSSKFAEIDSPYSIPIFDVIVKINKLFQLANFKSFNFPEKKYSLEKFNELTEKILMNDFYTHYFSTYKISKNFFSDFFSQNKKIENLKYYLPVTDNMPIPEVFEQFGIMLSHVGFTGFHFRFEFPLHPLIYTILTFQNPNQINEMKAEDIEQYFEVIKLNKFEGIDFLDTRKKTYELFLKSDSQFSNQYDASLKKLWDIEMMKYKMILLNIYKGFYRKTQNRSFSMFQNEIRKSDVTTLRFWFEGINFDNCLFDLEKKMKFISRLKFKLILKNENDEFELKNGKDFLQLFKKWMQSSDIHTILNFLTALSGVKILLPIDSYFRPLYFISSSFRRELHPFVIVPDQDGVIPIVRTKEEIDELVSHTLNDGDIDYINQETIFEDLISIDLN